MGYKIYDKNIHNRKSIRLKGYDYGQEGLYFITICCRDMKCLFGEVVDDIVCLNVFGEVVKQEWLNTVEIRDNISLGNYVVMPNHFHGIISIDYNLDSNAENYKSEFKSPSKNIGAIIRGVKGAASRRIKNIINSRKDELCNDESCLKLESLPALDINKSVWKRNYWDIIIRDNRAYTNISKYIENNPKNWKGDVFYM